MSQENTGARAFIAGEDLESYRRVKLSVGSGTQVEYVDAGEEFIGVTAAKTLAGDFVAVNLKTRGRTFKLVAADAISAGDSFYGATDGKISATLSGTAQGTLLETSAADSEVVEAILA